MNLLFLVGFNNYANRKVKLYSSTTDYINNSVRSAVLPSIQFNENDGVNVEQIVNWALSGDVPDYCIAYTTSDENVNTIRYRYYVMSWTRTRAGQYKAVLRRDVIADYYSGVLASPCFVERGPLASDSDLVFNSEGLSLNQIKKTETKLKDETGNAWIVGYFNREFSDTNNITGIFNGDTYPSLDSLGIVLNTSGDVTSGGKIKAIVKDDQIYLSELIQTNYHIPYASYCFNYFIGADGTGNNFRGYVSNGPNRAFEIDYRDIEDVDTTLLINVLADRATILSDIKTIISVKHSEYTNYANISRAQNGVICTYNNKYYRVTVTRTISSRETIWFNPSTEPAPYTDMAIVNQDIIRDYGLSGTSPNGNYLGTKYDLETVEVGLSEVPIPNQLRVAFKNPRNQLDDAPYDMVCLQYNLQNLSLAQSIMLKLGTHCYDFQILPYCPARFAIGNNNLDATDYSNIEQYQNGQWVVIDKMYYCKHSSDSFTIMQSIPIIARSENDLLNTKLSNECDYYRLTGPNYASSFELSVAKNGGVDKFHVEYTYRPISPFIHIAPHFKRLYGDINNDARGLILQGDFSIDRMSDEFNQYEIQNKNYQNIFNSKIKSMDAQHQIGMAQSGVGVLTSVAKGAVGGMITGNVVGAGIGAVAGLASGINNMVGSNERYKDQRQLEIDMYNYQLGNMKALPDTLTKVSAYNIINKYVPIVEYYTCSDEEVAMVENLIRYRSYKQSRITTIGSLPLYDELNFVKGQMIMINIADNDLVANEIYNEIYKGVYL